MIACLRGRLIEVLPDGAVIDVGGVGYRVFLTPKALASLPRGGEVLVHTVTYVREDALALYGFLSADERHAFELLISASGVGPKLALALLSVHSPDALRRAVSAGDADALMLVPGIGRKGAARLVLELKGKLGDGAPELAAAEREAGRPAYAEVREALAALGYAPAEIKAALESLPEGAGALPTQELLRLALRGLAPGGPRPAAPPHTTGRAGPGGDGRAGLGGDGRAGSGGDDGAGPRDDGVAAPDRAGDPA
jgi:holliday junction DNA helicase RuvA